MPTNPHMSKQKAQGGNQAGNLDDTGAGKPHLKATRFTTPRHLIERTKEELYEASKDADIPEGREQVVKTLASVLFMENISDGIENLDTLSYALLRITQLNNSGGHL